jgi:hypothetical protein
MIDGEMSVLPILTFDEKNTWENLLELSLPHLDSPGMQRLKVAVGDAAKSVAIERHYIDKDYRETFSTYHSKKFHTPDARCVRLHFFSRATDRATLFEPEYLDEDDYLGYSVIRPTRPNSIGRTMLRPEARSGTARMMGLCSEHVNILGREFSVSGFPFISQDADATVCAQATLWMLVRYFSNRYSVYPEVYPVQIGNLTRDYSVGRLFPTAGLYVWQMAEALRRVNFSPVIYSREEFGNTFEHLVYTYVESGIPVLAAFERHVVVLFGHQSDFSTIRQESPSTESPFLFSSRFNRAFVGNDDNGIPYQMLRITPTNTQWDEMLGNDGFFSLNQVQQFVVPLHERVFLPAEGAEKLMTALLRNSRCGYERLSPRIASGIPILRLFLTTGKAFKKQLRQRGRMGNSVVESVYRDLPLPHFIWVCEISHPHLYPEKVLGEVIWDATRNPYESNGFLAIHYPEKLIVDWGSAFNGEPDMKEFKLDNSIEYGIYCHNLKEIL